MVFLRERAHNRTDLLAGDRRELELVLRRRRLELASAQSREQEALVAAKLWWDAGAVKPDVVRNTFIKTMLAIGIRESTCPKSWRHTFATLLQDANVDPLIRQQVMGHRPTLNRGHCGNGRNRCGWDHRRAKGNEHN